MELHVWCPISGAPTLDANCLASVWLAQKSASDVRIMASSAVHLSPTGMLPLLLTEQGARVTGLPEIAEQLGFDIAADDLALLAHLQQLSVITQWTLFVIPENYEDVTRPEISNQIPFPMQYNTALALQRQAKSVQPDDTRPTKVEEGLNKLHAAMLEKKAAREQAQEIPKMTIRRMTQFSDITGTAKALGGGPVSDLLLRANLVLMSLAKLPKTPLEPLIAADPWLREHRDQGRALNFQVSLAEVPPQRKYSLMNVTATTVQDLTQQYVTGW